MWSFGSGNYVLCAVRLNLGMDEDWSGTNSQRGRVVVNRVL